MPPIPDFERWPWLALPLDILYRKPTHRRVTHEIFQTLSDLESQPFISAQWTVANRMGVTRNFVLSSITKLTSLRVVKREGIYLRASKKQGRPETIDTRIIWCTAQDLEWHNAMLEMAAHYDDMKGVPILLLEPVLPTPMVSANQTSVKDILRKRANVAPNSL